MIRSSFQGVYFIYLFWEQRVILIRDWAFYVFVVVVVVFIFFDIDI